MQIRQTLQHGNFQLNRRKSSCNSRHDTDAKRGAGRRCHDEETTSPRAHGKRSFDATAGKRMHDELHIFSGIYAVVTMTPPAHPGCKSHDYSRSLVALLQYRRIISTYPLWLYFGSAWLLGQNTIRRINACYERGLRQLRNPEMGCRYKGTTERRMIIFGEENARSPSYPQCSR